jgi:hypothetical protein
VAPKKLLSTKNGADAAAGKKKKCFWIDKKLFSSAPLMNMGYDKAILLTFLQLLKNEIFLRPSYFFMNLCGESYKTFYA